MIKKFKLFIVCLFVFGCSGGGEDSSSNDDNSGNNNSTNSSDSPYVPTGFDLVVIDDFNSFDNTKWSKGLTHDTNPDIRMIWNKQTGGENLLNNNYAGYLKDANVYASNGLLYLSNKKESITGTDPAREFDYSTGWINSLQKINFNGTSKDVYIEVKAKFPKGDKVWPAIWIIDDSENRRWPPEIDVWEYFGKFFRTNRKDEMYFRYIYGVWNDKKDHSYVLPNFQATYNSSAQHRIYGFKWTKDNMKWYIDGVLVHTKTKGVEVPQDDWPDQPMCMVINNGLMSVVEEGNTTFPNHLILDYFKLYEKN